MKQLTLIFLFLSTFLFGKEQYKRVDYYMGTRFEITVITDNKEKANQLLDLAYHEVNRIELLISSWKNTSETYEVNKNAGLHPVKVSDELFSLSQRSIKISELSDGAFDISATGMNSIWKFDGSVTSLPDSSIVKKSVAKVNYKNIILNTNNKTIFLKEKGMKIGFGAIGKGYAANRVKILLEKNGVTGGSVNAGGDLICWGNQANGNPWKIGIVDPKNKEKMFAWLTFDNHAIVTSGNYEKVIEIDGQQFSHIINPKTGWPVSELKSVTIICPDAEIADALATTISVLGTKKGLALLNSPALEGIEGILVDINNNVSTSANIQLNYYDIDSKNKEENFKIGLQ